MHPMIMCAGSTWVDETRSPRNEDFAKGSTNRTHSQAAEGAYRNNVT